MIKFITDESDKEEWNRVAEHPLQSWEWGEIKKNSGNAVLRLAEINGKGYFQNVYLFTLHKIPLGRLILSYAKGVWPSSEVFSYLKREYGKRAILVKLEPEVYLNAAGKYHLPILQKKWQENGFMFVQSNSPVFARHTFIVDLGWSEEELLSFMKTKTRYNLNLAKRKGVRVVDETNNPRSFDIFFQLYEETVGRQNYLGHSREYHSRVWETMKKAKMARILVSYLDHEPLSGYTLFFFKNCCYYLYGGSSQKHKEVMASNLLMWESIRLAKNMGCRYFDMWGALEKNYNPKHPWSGFHRFKEGFGGRHYSYLPTIDLVFKPWQYWLFSILWPARTKGLEFIRSFSRRSP